MALSIAILTVGSLYWEGGPIREAAENRHHQWFTPEYGHPKLREHLFAVMSLMRASATWPQFLAFPKLNATIGMPFDD